MKYEAFSEAITKLKTHQDLVCQTYKLGVDLSNFIEDLHKVVSLLFGTIYGEVGLGWIEWFCYENTQGNLDAHDENGYRICYSIESLWEFLEKNYKETCA
jgi:hypothetical protein